MHVHEIRLLMITGGAYIYGAEEISLKVIRHLSACYKVFCAVNGWNDGEYIKRLNLMNVPFKAIKLGWVYISKPIWTLDSLWHAPKAYGQYYNLIRKFSPTVLYHSSFRSVFLLSPLLKNNNVLHVHDRIPDIRTANFITKVDRKIHTYIAISEFVREDLLRIGIDYSKIELVYNGIDFSQVAHPDFPSEKNSFFHIGMVGQLVPRKGHLLLIHALAHLKSYGFDFRLHIFGEGSNAYRDHLDAEIKKNGMEAMVQWHGYVLNKDLIYSSVDFCVVPSIEPEPFGLTAIEPALFGRPVIASNIGALPEIISHGITGLLFNPSDTKDLMNSLLRMMENPFQMKEMGRQAQKQYAQLYSEQRMNAEIEKILIRASLNKG